MAHPLIYGSHQLAILMMYRFNNPSDPSNAMKYEPTKLNGRSRDPVISRSRQKFRFHRTACPERMG